MSEWRERFHAHYTQGKPDQCWLLESSKCHNGYGRFALNGTARIASRLAYEIANGPIHGGLHVLHSCDNRACVNPRHLRLGTHLENMAERNSRGRSRGGSLKGDLSPNSKLSSEDVMNIRQILAEGEMSQRAIGRKFGVSQSAISEIKNGKSW